jgi:N-acetylglucosamine kinase-like BadF-type ATPase
MTKKDGCDMSRFFVGVDIGATKSHALAANEEGRAVGFGTAGPGSYEVIGWEGLQQALRTITDQALGSAGIQWEQVAGAGFGVAGYDWPAEWEPTRQAIESLGFEAPYEFVNDAVIGLIAGASQGWGVAVTAGTSNNCYGRDRNGRQGRMTGCSQFGEYGGAVELVAKAVQAVAMAWTKRGPATRLTQLFCELVGATGEIDLLEGIALRRYYLSPDAAPRVFQVAAEGDEVAQETIRWAGRELGSLAVGVIRQLGFEALEFEVVLSGSLFRGGPMIIEPLQETVRAVAPGARTVRLTAPPVVGAVLLGMEQAGVEPTRFRQRLIESTGELLTGES